VRVRRAWSVADGTAITKSDADLDSPWFDAIADTDEEAREREFITNAARSDRRLAKKIRVFDV